MKHPLSILAALAFAAGTTMIGATAASAMPPDEPSPRVTEAVPAGPPNYPEYPEEPAGVPDTSTALTAVDDTGTEALQAGASAIGGAAIALATMWLVQRRRVHTA
ncbi:hypothetical protein AB0H36_22690 [Kribbella sp. NPDC050820]|uniref:hypothetical protein n=1 Tax=Kribbella sp. NPDC050820 TaxID=3155408 RepID=UPI0033FF9445